MIPPRIVGRMRGELTQVGAYSENSLIENAEIHLSSLAQSCVTEQEKRDARLAGACLALHFHTACGFHSMRLLESGARNYHRIVTGVEMNDVPLGAILNGDKSYKGSGLVNKWTEEGSQKDSPLGLITTLLSHINKIYRCPIMHPEMTLTADLAKLVFDLSFLAFSSMTEDAKDRFNQAQAATGGKP